MDYISSRFARFANSSNLSSFPPLARQRAVDAITDCIGCALAGARQPAARFVSETLPLSESPRRNSASYVLTGGYASPMDAALYHGAASHALDYDDTNHPGYAHPSAAIVPALLAVAPIASSTGQDLVTAYIVGFELIGKLGRALNKSHYAKGWHPTATFGALAAGLAAGQLLKLTEEQLVVTLAIAASQAGGLRANFGTMIKPLHAGLAARAGVMAALIAAKGFDGADDVFEHRFGYFAVFQGAEGPRMEELVPGSPLEITTEFGLALKPYPSCGATHPGIEACRRLHDWCAGMEVTAVRIGYSEMARNPLIFSRPESPLQGKFSMEYCAAVALLDGDVNLRSFEPDNLRRVDIGRLMERTTVTVDDRVRDDSEFATAVEVSRADGECVEILVPLAKGKPDRWLTEAEMAAKFTDCSRYGGVMSGTSDLFHMLRQIDAPVAASALLHGLEGIRYDN